MLLGTLEGGIKGVASRWGVGMRPNLFDRVIIVSSALIPGTIFAADLVPVRPPFFGPDVPSLVIVGGIMGLAIWLAGKLRERNR